MRFLLVALLLGFGHLAGWAQPSMVGPFRPSHRLLGVDQGLVSPALISVTQDAQGIIWVGGESGLFLFDGQRFHLVPLPVRDRFVNNIWPQKDGSLLVATLEGLIHLWPDGRVPAKVVLPRDPKVLLLQQDAEGRIYADREGTWCSFLLGGQPEPLPGWQNLPPMIAFTNLPSGERMAMDGSRIWLQAKPNDPPRMIAPPNYRPGEHPMDLIRDGAGWLWVRTDQRALCQDREGSWKETVFPGPFLPNGSMLELDGEGWVWFFGQHSVVRVRGQEQRTFAIGPQGALVNAVLLDREGTPWLATQDGMLQVLGQGQWDISDVTAGLPSSLIWDITRDGLGHLWAHTQSGTAVLANGGWKPLIGGRMMRSFRDRDGAVWFAGNPGDRLYRGDPRTLTLTSYPTPIKPGSELVYGIARDAEGVFWLLSNHNRLYRSAMGPPFRWEAIAPPATTVAHPFWTLHPLEGGRVFLGAQGRMFECLGSTFTPVEGTLPQVPDLVALDARGRMVVGYFATQRLTVHEFREGRYQKTGEWSALEAADPPLIMYALAFDPSGRLWVGTSRGLVELDREGQRVGWHPAGGGIPSGDINFRALLVERDALWVGTPKGLGRFAYTSYPPSQRPPLPHLLELKVQGLPQKVEALHLPRRNNLLEARFVVPSYLNASTLLLEYRLNQGPWKDMESSRIRLESLSAGTYKLEIRGRYRYGLEGPILALPFEVMPGWWERKGFFAALALLLAGITAGIVRLGQAALVRQNTRLQAEVAARTQELEQASQAKSAFLASMSHELRTPLNAILLYAELLGEGAREREDLETISDTDKIARSGKHLLSLLNGIMDLSKIEAGKMDLHKEEIAPALLIQETVSALGPLAAERGNALVVEIEPGLPALLTDGTKVRQILINLGGNACKFTEKGTITLRVRRSAEGIRFEVQDTGIGLTPEQQKRIFLPYEQANRDTQAKYGGTGLGLALSIKLSNLLGASLWVKSQQGMGTCFFLECPLDGR